MEFVEIYLLSEGEQYLDNTVIVFSVDNLLNDMQKLSDVICDSLPYEDRNIENGIILYVLSESYEVFGHFPFHDFNASAALDILKKYKLY